MELSVCDLITEGLTTVRTEAMTDEEFEEVRKAEQFWRGILLIARKYSDK